MRSKLPELSARVLDADGEIILIEAADQVPRLVLSYKFPSYSHV